MSLLHVDALIAGYGEVPILNGVSIDVDLGELVVLIGPNGAGKSTLLKCIAGLLRITEGSISLDGSEITHDRAEKRLGMGVAYVPQSSNVFPGLTGRENLELGFRGASHSTRRGLRPRIDEICDLFPELKGILRSQAYVLSGGQRQTLAFAKALMSEPRLMLLDEPSAGLSPRLVGDIFRHIKHLVTLGIGVLLVEQNARQALSVGDRGYVLDGGRNALTGPAKELLSDQRTVALYLGQGGQQAV